jgi:predicted RNA methylase
MRVRKGLVDLVVMNPPFGTREEGIDIKFLEVASEICLGSIYSMHKSSTRGYIKKWA